ncbi:hypothetical protein E4U36_004132 [Claviceps purpurea]|nr:hypothetical protein E4U36_004132 [Claviceps purpurea]
MRKPVIVTSTRSRIRTVATYCDFCIGGEKLVIYRAVLSGYLKPDEQTRGENERLLGWKPNEFAVTLCPKRDTTGRLKKTAIDVLQGKISLCTSNHLCSPFTLLVGEHVTIFLD